MAFEALSSIPCEFESGNSVTVTMPLPDVLPSEGEAKLYLSLNGTAVDNFVATESGDEFTFTITAAESAALVPGIYDWAIYFVYTGTQRISQGTGRVQVTANLAASQTPSFWQAEVTRLQTALALLSASDKISVSFNGQSFQRANMKEYRESLLYAEARVVGERRKAARARGECVPTTYAPHFGGCC
jgi:hypothetical protein